MPASKKTSWLICYDIADPDRLRRIHGEVRRYASPFQYSVFRTSATRRQVVARIETLGTIAAPREDDIRAYPLLTASVPVVYGRNLLAGGIHHLDVQLQLFDNSFRDEPCDGWP